MVNGVGAPGIDPGIFDDPAMAAEAAMLDALRAERGAAREEQQGARAERDAHFERGQREEGYAANARLASAWIGAGGRIIEGAAAVSTAGLDPTARASGEAGRRERIEGGVRVASGVLTAGSAAVDFAASGHGAASRAHEHARSRANERAEDARERAASAAEAGARVLGRIEDIARAERQAEDQRIANLRG
jgi:hypothetical protein